MNLVDQFVLGVRLKAYDFMTAGICPSLQTGFNIRKGCRAIDIGFALAEQIKVWTIKDEKLCQGYALTKSYGSARAIAGRHGRAKTWRRLQVVVPNNTLVRK